MSAAGALGTAFPPTPGVGLGPVTAALVEAALPGESVEEALHAMYPEVTQFAPIAAALEA